MEIKGFLGVIRREFCRNHMKLIEEDEKRAATNYAIMGQICPSISAISLYLSAFSERMAINMTVYMSALTVIGVICIVHKKFRRVERKNYPYKKVYRISYLLFIATMIVSVLVIILVFYAKFQGVENEFKRLSLLSMLIVAFLLLAQYLFFSVIPTILEIWRLKKQI